MGCVGVGSLFVRMYSEEIWNLACKRVLCAALSSKGFVERGGEGRGGD
jgi:hypothetical protein